MTSRAAGEDVAVKTCFRFNQRTEKNILLVDTVPLLDKSARGTHSLLVSLRENEGIKPCSLLSFHFYLYVCWNYLYFFAVVSPARTRELEV